MQQPEGIEGVTGRPPVGCVLSIGIRDKARGFPTQKDRFHLLEPVPSGGSGKLQWREHDSKFRAYNALAPERRTTIYGALVGHAAEDCMEHHLKAQKISGLTPVRQRPACIGDGKTAQRWDNETGDYLQIQCPHERCQYRLTTPPACKPFMRLLFRIVWPAALTGTEWPSVLCRFTSGSWNTIRNALGLFEEVEKAAAAMGLDAYSLYGYPFTMSLQEQTNREKKSRFPVVHFSATQSPEAFFLNQRRQLEEMGGKPIARITDMRDEETVAQDFKEISFPGGNK